MRRRGGREEEGEEERWMREQRSKKEGGEVQEVKEQSGGTGREENNKTKSRATKCTADLKSNISRSSPIATCSRGVKVNSKVWYWHNHVAILYRHMYVQPHGLHTTSTCIL